MLRAKTWVGFLGQGNPAQAFGDAPLFARLRSLLLPWIRGECRNGAGTVGFAADLQVDALKVGLGGISDESFISNIAFMAVRD